jgi:hypothetical protein
MLVRAFTGPLRHRHGRAEHESGVTSGCFPAEGPREPDQPAVEGSRRRPRARASSARCGSPGAWTASAARKGSRRPKTASVARPQGRMSSSRNCWTAAEWEAHAAARRTPAAPSGQRLAAPVAAHRPDPASPLPSKNTRRSSALPRWAACSSGAGPLRMAAPDPPSRSRPRSWGPSDAARGSGAANGRGIVHGAELSRLGVLRPLCGLPGWP